MGDGAHARTSAVELPVQPSAQAATTTEPEPGNKIIRQNKQHPGAESESFVKYPAKAWPKLTSGRTRQSEKGQCYNE